MKTCSAAVAACSMGENGVLTWEVILVVGFGGSQVGQAGQNGWRDDFHGLTQQGQHTIAQAEAGEAASRQHLHLSPLTNLILTRVAPSEAVTAKIIYNAQLP